MRIGHFQRLTIGTNGGHRHHAFGFTLRPKLRHQGAHQAGNTGHIELTPHSPCPHSQRWQVFRQRRGFAGGSARCPHCPQRIRAGMVTRARKVAGGYRLTGNKMWISNSPIADVFVIWAKDDEGQIRGFVLD